MGEIYFGGLLGGKTLRRANIQNGWQKLEEKNGSVWLYLNIPKLDTLILCLVGVLHLLEIQRQDKTFTMLSLLRSCLRFLVNRISIKLSLQCIKWLCNIFLHLPRRKKLSHSARIWVSFKGLFIWEKLPRLGEKIISTWC